MRPRDHLEGSIRLLSPNDNRIQVLSPAVVWVRQAEILQPLAEFLHMLPRSVNASVLVPVIEVLIAPGLERGVPFADIREWDHLGFTEL